MTRAEFHRWIEERGSKGKTHYEELLEVAFRRTRIDGAKQGSDAGQGAAEEAVHNAVARALDSETLAELDPVKVWPWMVDAVRSVVEHARRGAKRASRTHRQWAGAFQGGEERGSRRTPYFGGDSDRDEKGSKSKVYGPIDGRTKLSRVVAHDPNHNDDENGHDFVGPHGDWRGEYTIAHIGPCGTCGAYGAVAGPHGGYKHVGQSWSRLEVGRDRERMGYSKRWTVEALMAIEHAVRKAPANSLERLAGFALGCVAADSANRTTHRTFQVIGCWNGHRSYTGEMP